MRHVKLSHDEVIRAQFDALIGKWWIPIRGTRASPCLQESEEVEEERTVLEEVADMLVTAFSPKP